MNKTEFIREALAKDPQATYQEVNRSWIDACQAAGWVDPTGPNIGRISWQRVAVGYKVED